MEMRPISMTMLQSRDAAVVICLWPNQAQAHNHEGAVTV